MKMSENNQGHNDQSDHSGMEMGDNHGSMEQMDMDHGSMQHTGQNDMMMHGGHMMHMGNLKRKFWVSLVLTIPLVLMSSMMGMNHPLISFPGSDWVVAILGTAIFLYGGTPFFSGAKGELKSKKPAMMTLITMGIGVAYFYSIYSVIANDIFQVTPSVMDFFWELATLVDIMLLGHWIEMNAVMNAGSALTDLAELLPTKAHLLDKDGHTKDVALKDVKEGNTLQVRGGEKIPADGTVTTGESAVNEAMVTGESKLVQKKKDAKVFGGSVNGDGTFQMKVTGTGENGFLAQVSKMVQAAQNEKSSRENIADKVASWLFYIAVTIAVISFVIWLITSGLATALSRAVTVLLIACPHALGLAIPLVVARSTSLGAKNGLLIRDRGAMEQVGDLKYALMDKTGTLTEGDFKVNKYGSLTSDKTDDEVLATMAALEAGSSHPLAVGITKKAHDRHLDYSSADDSSQIKGVGLEGTISSKKYLIVSPGYLEKNSISYDKKRFGQLAGGGNSLSFLLQNKNVLGFVAQGDQIKPAAHKMILELDKQGIIPVMLTGDNEETAKGVAEKLGIKDFKAQLLPADKEKAVENYQNDGKVMMIGDGVNDAPSLARANIGVAIGSGTDVAIESADLVLVKSDPNEIIEFIELAKKTTGKMTQNLWWGAGYNIIALPLAAGILAPIGFVLSPMAGAVLMSLSTVIVAVNAITLKI